MNQSYGILKFEKIKKVVSQVAKFKAVGFSATMAYG